MRSVHPAVLLVCSAALCSTASALAEQRPKARHNSSKPSADTTRTAAAAAYMSGKQSLVGWHAPSDRAPVRDARGRAMLALTTINRGESLAIAATSDDGGFDSVDLDRVAHLLRAMTGDEHPIDPRTLALVYRIQTHFAAAEIRVISGYRVPKPGSHSNHGKGRAIDFAVPGVPDEEVANYARDMGFVGIGVYPTSQFLHLDVRPRSYFWVDYSGPHTRNRESGILGDLAARSDAAAVARGQSPIEPFAMATDVDAALRARGMATTPAAAVAAQDEEDEEN